MAAKKREYDLVVWGATGFTGKLVVEYLLERYGARAPFRWAIGGRNPKKLEGVCGDLGVEPAALPIVVGDNDDEQFLAELARQAKVVCSTVGPYARFGSKLVAACAAAGTHYCDLTGELQWIRRMIDRHTATAEKSGARIVHSCGFDCIPSDIGVFFLQQEMRRAHGVPCRRVKYRVRSFRGGFSGGTIASMFEMMAELERDKAVRTLLADPYGLNPENARQGPDAPDQIKPVYDEDFASWTGPFVMAALNTRVVRRTNALTDYAYGRDFQYDEAVLTGAGPSGFAKALGVSAGLGGAMAVGGIGALRRLAARFAPAPGEGPSRQEREKGYFDIELLGEHPHDRDKNLRARVYGDRDPGYGSTAKMLGESAVCLAVDELGVGGGFWTTAAAMGAPLLNRLNENAGVSLTLS
jgi:short subunit dehydrogenase-like uncharacterized protein